MKYQNGEYYHLYNRGAHKENIFFADENYSYLLSLMTANAERFCTSVAAYCLMPNHFHFIVRQEETGSISKCIQITFNAYTQAINKQNKLSGTLFQGKTQSRHIDSAGY
jgi:putative transposase